MLESFNFEYLGCQPITDRVLGQLSLGDHELICIQVRQFLRLKLFISSTNIREATFEEQEGRTEAWAGAINNSMLTTGPNTDLSPNIVIYLNIVR